MHCHFLLLVQTLTLSVTDAVTARMVVRIVNADGRSEKSVMGEVELSVVGMVAAEKAVATAAAAVAASRSIVHTARKHDSSDTRSSLPERRNQTVARSGNVTVRRRKMVETENDPQPVGATVGSEKFGTTGSGFGIARLDGVEAWFPLFISSRGGGNREREPAGEVRLSFRFLSADFMLQRELTAGADAGDNGPIGSLRYALERRPGRLRITIRCCRALQKAMIGDRAPLVEARLRPGEWTCSTRRQAGLDPIFNENMIAEILWAPQDFSSPVLLLEVKDKALGGGKMAVVRVPVAPFILHPRMHAEVWYPLSRDDVGEAAAGIFCDLVYLPSPGGIHGDETLLSEPPSANRIVSIREINPDMTVAANRSRSGILHVEVISARGLPASSKDPQVGVRLRVPDHRGSPLPPFQRTVVVRGGRAEPQFESTFLLSLKQAARSSVEHVQGESLGRTPVLEVEAWCARGKGKSLGTVEIPVFPLWFTGHMTRTWYPMRSADGKAEAGSVFLGMQFLADAGSGRAATDTAATTSDNRRATGRRRFLFVEVRQGRDLRRVHSLSGQDPAVHLQMLGSGASGKTPPARDGGKDPEWREGTGMVTIPYGSCGIGVVEDTARQSNVLRITVINERGCDSEREIGTSARRREGGDWVIGQCDWPVPTNDADNGLPMSAWHTLWMGGEPTGEVYLRCRLGFEGEALDHSSRHRALATGEDNATLSPLTAGNYHVELLDVRGFERTVRRRRLCSDTCATDESRGAGIWEGKAYMAAAPATAGDIDSVHGAPAACVGSGRAVAVSTRGRGGGRFLCVQISTMVGSPSDGGDRSDGLRSTSRKVQAACSVTPDKLKPLTEVPGSELREWFPVVAVHSGGSSEVRDGGEEADTGQVLISVRYAPLAVGVLEVAVLEAELPDSLGLPRSVSGTFRALSRISPAKTGASMGHRVRSTPGRRGVRKIEGEERCQHLTGDTVLRCSWEDTRPHCMRFNSAFNERPTTLHISVLRGDGMVGYATVATEAIVQNTMTSMARNLDTGRRKSRGSAHDVGPIGNREDDFGEPTEAWYPLHSPVLQIPRSDGNKQSSASKKNNTTNAILSDGTEVGKVRVLIRFAPHPMVLLPNWQEAAAIQRAKGIMAMKAVFYRVNRTGNLVVDKEDLRAALVEAVETFIVDPEIVGSRPGRGITTSSAGLRGVHRGGGGMAWAGKFIIHVMQVLQAGRTSYLDFNRAQTAVDAIFTTMERDRSGEVTFSEFCAFLLNAAARYAEAEVGDLLDELAFDNDDDSDVDSEDDVEITPDSSKACAAEDPRLRRHGQGEALGNGVVRYQQQLPQCEDAVKNGACTGEGRRMGDQLCAPAMCGKSVIVTTAGGNEKATHTAVFGAHPAGQGSVKSPRLGSSTALTASGVSQPSRSQVIGYAVPREHGFVGRGRTEQTFQAVTGPVAPEHEPTTRFFKDIKSWTVGHVLGWLVERLQLPQYVEPFRDASVDGLVLVDLNDDLLKDMGVPYPLHRLKILRHTQEMIKQQRAREKQAESRLEKRNTQPLYAISSSHHSEGFPHKHTGRTTKIAERPRNWMISDGEGEKQTLAVTKLPMNTRSCDRKTPGILGTTGAVSMCTLQVDREMAGPMDQEPQPPPVELALNRDSYSVEEAFAHAMDEVRDEYLREGDDSGSISVSFGRSKNRRRRVPTNATTSEVFEVVKNAMWEAATVLEDRYSASAGAGSPKRHRSEYPEAWGSSDGGSMHDIGNQYGASARTTLIDSVACSPFELRGVNLLFAELIGKDRGTTSKRPRNSGGLRLTRPRLAAGIRHILGIEMRWEQFDQFFHSLVDRHSTGCLNLDDFSRAFAFSISATSPESVSSRSSTCEGPGSTPSSTAFGWQNRSNVETNPRTSARESGGQDVVGRAAKASQDMGELRECVMGMADTLRDPRLTLQAVLAKFDPHNSGKVRKNIGVEQRSGGEIHKKTYAINI